jgi:hypothetical protein
MYQVSSNDPVFITRARRSNPPTETLISYHLEHHELEPEMQAVWNAYAGGNYE